MRKSSKDHNLKNFDGSGRSRKVEEGKKEGRKIVELVLVSLALVVAG